MNKISRIFDEILDLSFLWKELLLLWWLWYGYKFSSFPFLSPNSTINTSLLSFKLTDSFLIIFIACVCGFIYTYIPKYNFFCMCDVKQNSQTSGIYTNTYSIKKKIHGSVLIPMFTTKCNQLVVIIFNCTNFFFLLSTI